MSYVKRIARIAARVAEARRPKNVGAGIRLVQPARPAETIAAATPPMPTVTPSPEPQQAHTPATSLPMSGEAARWLIAGEVPPDLIPVLGDPIPPTSEHPQQQPTPPPSYERSRADAQQSWQGQHASRERVVARIVEGAQMPSAAPGERASRETHADAVAELGVRPRPSAIVEELPGSRREPPPPLLRLARSPLPAPAPALDALPSRPAPPTSLMPAASPHKPAAPAPLTPVVSAHPPAAPAAPPAQVVSAQELARLSGGELSEDGTGQSTVSFASSGAAAAVPARAADADLASETPTAPGLRAQLGDLDVDELYEGFLQRLRRDLLHDRERLGDLLGPLP